MTGRIALRVNRHVIAEATRRSKGWNTFRERLAKRGLRYRYTPESREWMRINGQKKYEWNMYGQWALKSFNVVLWVGDIGMPVRGIGGHHNRKSYYQYPITGNHRLW